MSKAEEYLKKNTEYNFESDECDIFHLSTIAKLMQSFADEQNKEMMKAIISIEDLCNNEEPSHEYIWRIVNEFLNRQDNE